MSSLSDDGGVRRRRVDPDGRRESRRRRRSAHEALGVELVRGVEAASALSAHEIDAAEVDVGGSHPAEPAVMVLVVIPVEESHAVIARVLDRSESVGVFGPVLDRLEVRLVHGLSSET